MRRRSLKTFQSAENSPERLLRENNQVDESILEKLKRLNTKKQQKLQDDLNRIEEAQNTLRKSKTTVNFHRLQVNGLPKDEEADGGIVTIEKQQEPSNIAPILENNSEHESASLTGTA